MSKPTLTLDWCSHAAAKFAVENWHYSHKMPKSKVVKLGVWENGHFIGAIMFSHGANNNLGNPFQLRQTSVCELARIALRSHLHPVSQIMGIAIKMLKRQSPKLRLIVSYADPKENHHGGIYQAMNWNYLGISRPQRELLVAGQFMHKRTASSTWGTASPDKIAAITGLSVTYGPIEWKHSYYLPLDAEMRKQIEPLAKPYPKRVTSIDSDATGNQPGKGGATPTVTLQT